MNFNWSTISAESVDRLGITRSFVAVVPEDDLIDHQEFSPRCWCCPMVEMLRNGGIKIVHNSLDQREIFENCRRN